MAIKPCKHLIFDTNRYKNIELVSLCVANFQESIKAWKRDEKGCDGSYYCQFCDKGNKRVPYAAMCYGDRDCYEVDE